MAQPGENPLEGVMQVLKMLGKALEPGGSGQDIWSTVTGRTPEPAPANDRDRLLFSQLAKLSEQLDDVLLELKAVRQHVAQLS